MFFLFSPKFFAIFGKSCGSLPSNVWNTLHFFIHVNKPLSTPTFNDIIWCHKQPTYIIEYVAYVCAKCSILFLSHSFLRSFTDTCDIFLLAVVLSTGPTCLPQYFTSFLKVYFQKVKVLIHTFNTKFRVRMWHVQDESEHCKPP